MCIFYCCEGRKLDNYWVITSPSLNKEYCIVLYFPEDGVFFRVFYRNLALLLFCVFLLAFIVLLQNKHTSLAENGENLIGAQPLISAHSQGPKI